MVFDNKDDDADSDEKEGQSQYSQKSGRHNSTYKKKVVSKMRNSLASLNTDQQQMFRSVSLSATHASKLQAELANSPNQKSLTMNMAKVNLSEDDDPDEKYEDDGGDDDEYDDEDDGNYYSGMDDVETDINDDGILKRPGEFLENFTAMYGGPLKSNVKGRCIIMPSAKWKLVWDFWVVFLLLIVSLLVPYRLAFDPEDSTGWLIVYYGIDSCFAIDMIFTFLTATIDP